MTERVCKVWRPTRHIIGHFGDESFQAINCTGTDNQKQSNTTLHTPETQKRNRKKLPYLIKQSKPWFGTAFTTSGQETEWALFLQPQTPPRAGGQYADLRNSLTAEWCLARGRDGRSSWARWRRRSRAGRTETWRGADGQTADWWSHTVPEERSSHTPRRHATDTWHRYHCTHHRCMHHLITEQRRHMPQNCINTEVAPDITSGPGPGRNPAKFSYPAISAPAGYGRRIWGRIWGRIWPSFDASASLCNWAGIHRFTNSVICTSLFHHWNVDHTHILVSVCISLLVT